MFFRKGKMRLEAELKQSKDIISVPWSEALGLIEDDKKSTETQKQFMRATVNSGTVFWHDFGEGSVCILDISRFFNHGVDIKLIEAITTEMAEKLGEIEASVALTAASGGNIITYSLCRQLGIEKMIYAPKKPTVIQERNGVLKAQAYSYTGGHAVDLAVASDLLLPGDKVLFSDDFLDTGKMTASALSIIEQSGAELVACAFGVNKRYADGEQRVKGLLSGLGLGTDRMVSFIDIANMTEGIVQFDGFNVGFRLKRQ